MDNGVLLGWFVILPNVTVSDAPPVGGFGVLFLSRFGGFVLGL